jgi:hypothetical protein
MPPLPVITDVARVTLDWLVGDVTQMVNVLHFLTDFSDESDVQNAISGNLTNNMVASMSSEASLVGMDVLFLNGTSSTVHIPFDGSFTGTGGSDWIPQSAQIISLATGNRGPSHRGRVYLPAVAESKQSGGLVDGVTLASVQGAWETALDAWASAGVLLVVASYALGTADPVTAVTAKQRTGTQRRRNH